VASSWWSKFLDMCWNASSSEQSEPSKQHRFSSARVQAALPQPIPGPNNRRLSAPDRITASNYATGTLTFLARFFRMSSNRVIVEAIKVAQNLLWQNLPPTHNLSDAATVLRFRELVRSPAVRSALERSSDTLLAFALRAVERVLSDQSLTHSETINRLWDVLDDPHLNQALGVPPNSRMTFGPHLRRR
jgi:hypothetical protein